MCKERHTLFPKCTHSTYILLPCRRYSTPSTRCPSFRIYNTIALDHQDCPDCRPSVRFARLTNKGNIPPKNNNGGGKIPMPPGSTGATDSTIVSPEVEEGSVIEDEVEDEVVFEGEGGDGAANGNGVKKEGTILKYSWAPGDDKLNVQLQS